MERKVCFILEVGNLGRGGGEMGGMGGDAYPKAKFPWWQSGGKSFYRQSKGAKY